MLLKESINSFFNSFRTFSAVFGFRFGCFLNQIRSNHLVFIVIISAGSSPCTCRSSGKSFAVLIVPGTNWFMTHCWKANGYGISGLCLRSSRSRNRNRRLYCGHSNAGYNYSQGYSKMYLGWRIVERFKLGV